MLINQISMSRNGFNAMHPPTTVVYQNSLRFSESDPPALPQQSSFQTSLPTHITVSGAARGRRDMSDKGPSRNSETVLDARYAGLNPLAAPGGGRLEQADLGAGLGGLGTTCVSWLLEGCLTILTSSTVQALPTAVQWTAPSLDHGHLSTVCSSLMSCPKRCRR